STSSSFKSLAFPSATQAQIIRANQRDIIHVSELREQTESVLRTWLGTRWLNRWDKEVELSAKLVYYWLTTGRGMLTLGEEYTDIWQRSKGARRLPSRPLRLALILLPTIPSYLLARFSQRISDLPARVANILRNLPTILEVISEVNLAIFYIRGTYYDPTKRILGIQHITPTPEDPNSQPPSYSLLGILLLVRLTYRLITALKSLKAEESNGPSNQQNAASKNMYIDTVNVSKILNKTEAPDYVKDAEKDAYTILDVARLDRQTREGRKCPLCLEERTESAVTECGHMFCWPCIVDWGREKPECPLCRQALDLTKLLPIYNL
ncbi:hypothetical protein SISSUDRAFT_959188, partial [Sistotremastrum suecicum HHB10207 ss-3]